MFKTNKIKTQCLLCQYSRVKYKRIFYNLNIFNINCTNIVNKCDFVFTVKPFKIKVKKSRIRVTPNRSTDADSSLLHFLSMKKKKLFVI